MCSMTCFPAPHTLSGNSKQECREDALEFNPTGHLENTGKTIAGLFSLLSGGNDTPPDNSQVPPPKKKKRRRNKDVFNNYKISIMQNEDDLRGLAKGHGLYAGNQYFICSDKLSTGFVTSRSGSGVSISG